MSGLSASTGRALSGMDHIRQSINHILTTPIGSRIQRRAYGSFISELLDQPINPAIKLQIQAACVMAITQWEPRIAIEGVEFSLEKGRATLDIRAIRLDSGTAQTFEVAL